MEVWWGVRPWEDVHNQGGMDVHNQGGMKHPRHICLGIFA